MNREEFLDRLRRELDGLPAREVDEIIKDYKSYFAEALAAGRNIDDVVAAHGDPRQLGRELRTEMGLRRWEHRHTPANFRNVVFALSGLAAVDIFVLLPVLLILGLITVILCFVLSLLGIIGIGHLLSLTPISEDPVEGSATSLLLSGIGLLTASFGGGFLLIVALRAAMMRLARYARLHYRLLRPGKLGMGQSSMPDLDTTR